MNVVFKHRMREAFFTCLFGLLLAGIVGGVIGTLYLMFTNPLFGLGLLIGLVFVYTIGNLVRHR